MSTTHELTEEQIAGWITDQAAALGIKEAQLTVYTSSHDQSARFIVCRNSIIGSGTTVAEAKASFLAQVKPAAERAAALRAEADRIEKEGDA